MIAGILGFSKHFTPLRSESGLNFIIRECFESRRSFGYVVEPKNELAIGNLLNVTCRTSTRTSGVRDQSHFWWSRLEYGDKESLREETSRRGKSMLCKMKITRVLRE